MLKTSLIIFLFLAVLTVGCGSFYYFEIYQPQTYVSLILSLYQRLENIGLQPDTSSIKNVTDYESAFTVLQKRIYLLESIQTNLAQIYTPKRMVNIKKEFADYLTLIHAQHAHAILLTSFMKGADQLQGAIKNVQSDVAQGQNKVATMGDLQKFWSEHIPHIQTLGEDLFRKEITELTNPSFMELKILWQDASPAFDLVLKKSKAANPNLLINQAGNLFTPTEARQLEKYSKHLEEFNKKLEALIKQYSAYDLLAFRYFPNVSPIEASERTLGFYQTIQKLKEQYTQ